MRFVTVGEAPAVMMSPQSPVASAFVKLTAMALLQHPPTVELVVDEVEVVVRDVEVDVLVRDVEVEVLVRDVEVDVLVRDGDVEVDVLVRDVDVEVEVATTDVLVRDVEVEVDVLVRDVEVEVEVATTDVLVRDVEVEEDVDVVAGGAVELLVELVDEVPPPGVLQLFGAGESLRLRTPSTFLTSRPPNSAQ